MDRAHPAVAAVGRRAPVVGVCRNPLQHLRDVQMHEVAVGISLLSLKPETVGTLRCIVNGEALYPITARQFAQHVKLLSTGNEDEARAYLQRSIRRALNWKKAVTRPGDVIIWQEMPQDKEDLRTIISIAAIAVSIATAGTTSAWVGAALSAASVAYNILVPPSVRKSSELADANNVASTSLSGNQARLDQPIWRNCGVNKITPPFAAQPYSEFLDSGKRDEAGRPVDADQYYYAVFAVGVGRHDVIRAFIGKTPVERYKDVLQATYLKPGVQPAVALCNVITSAEVAGIPLEDVGAYAGGFAATKPTQRATAIGVDMLAPQGMGTYKVVDDTPEPVAVTMRWRVEVREIDDYGRIIGTWRSIANETRTANTNTPQRWSNRYELETPTRVEVRVVRLDVKDTGANTRSELQWGSLRAYLSEPAPLNPNTAHYEVVMRASGQLNPQTQTDFSMIVQGYARIWNPDTGWSCDLLDYDNYTATRNPAWYLADLWLDPIWGEGIDEDHVDLAGLYAFSQSNETRQDRFDYAFDTSMTAWDAAQLIARAGRARVFRHFGVLTLSRDELVTLPKTAFSPRNTLPKTMSATEKLPGIDVSDGYVIEFKSNISWDIATVECPCPGFTVTNESSPRYNAALPKMTRPTYLRLDGINGATHAEREGLFEAARMLLRTRLVNCTTAMPGVIVSFMDAIHWQPEVAGYGQSGDVAFWDADALVMGLTEPPDFSGSATSWLTLMRDDGSLTVAVEVTPGPGANDVVLPAAPDFDMVLDSGTRERPKFFLGHLDQLVRVSMISDGGKSDADDGEIGAQLYDITGFVDDDRVHAADNFLLPGPGDNQDPIDDGSTTGDTDEGVVEPNLTDRLFSFGGNSYATVRMNYILPSTGLARQETYGEASLYSTTSLTGEWMLAGEIEPAVAALYEVRVTNLGGNLISGTLDTWLPLSADQTWTSGDVGPGSYNFQFRVEIREISTGIVQTSARIQMDINNSFHD